MIYLILSFAQGEQFFQSGDDAFLLSKAQNRDKNLILCSFFTPLPPVPSTAPVRAFTPQWPLATIRIPFHLNSPVFSDKKRIWTIINYFTKCAGVQYFYTYTFTIYHILWFQDKISARRRIVLVGLHWIKNNPIQQTLSVKSGWSFKAKWNDSLIPTRLVVKWLKHICLGNIACGVLVVCILHRIWAIRFLLPVRCRDMELFQPKSDLSGQALMRLPFPFSADKAAVIVPCHNVNKAPYRKYKNSWYSCKYQLFCIR